MWELAVDIRRLEEGDLFNGFLSSLDSLRKASDIPPSKAMEIFRRIVSNPDHVILVAVMDGRVVGSTTLLIEPKFIHGGGLVGHIEDVVVDRAVQGHGVGRRLILSSLEHAKGAGCYKTVLDCTDDVRPFYEGLGFRLHSNAMRFNL